MKVAFYILLFVPLVFQSCWQGHIEPPPVTHHLRFDYAIQTLPENKDSVRTAILAADTNWVITVRPEAAWLKVSPVSGTGTQQISFTSLEANTTGHCRQTYIVASLPSPYNNVVDSMIVWQCDSTVNVLK